MGGEKSALESEEICLMCYAKKTIMDKNLLKGDWEHGIFSLAATRG
jgi:hypothetical protein